MSIKIKHDLFGIPADTNFVVVYRGFGSASTLIFGDTYRFSGEGRILQVLNGSKWEEPSDHWTPVDDFDMVEAIIVLEE